MTSPPTITAALITLNEERRLPALLPRLSWVDEIVVVDGGSTDQTVAIAQAHGCRVQEHAFDTFAAQRNRAIALARSQWVLSIDADERPTPALIAEIRGQLISGRYDAFRVPIRSRIFGRPFRYSGTQDDRPVRLFRRGAAVWEGDVHEVLRVRGPVGHATRAPDDLSSGSSQQPGCCAAAGLLASSGRIGQLRNWLEHETLPDLASFLQKMDRYTTLAAEQRVAAGRAPRWRERWLAPAIEAGRRLIWKQGLLDGPQGWAFSLLSGLSQWVLADKHYRAWLAQRDERRATACTSALGVGRSLLDVRPDHHQCTGTALVQ
jgi:glycosyltransferase involved in cell wall biosynthesis